MYYAVQVYVHFSGVQIYRKFYSEDKEKSNGVLAICVLVMDCQAYITLANLVSVSSMLIIDYMLFFCYLSPYAKRL